MLRMKRYTYIIYGIVSLVMLLAGCSEELASSSTRPDMEEGDEVQFTTYVPGRAVTRSTAKEDFLSIVNAYKAVNDDYRFTIKMFKEDVEEVQQTGNYQPVTTVTGAGTAGETVSYDADGTLQPSTGEGDRPLYWPDKTGRYAFEAVAGSDVIATDQSTKVAWLLQDRLHGYGFVPQWNEAVINAGTGTEVTAAGPAFNIDALNYRTMTEWRTANESIGLTSVEQYKKIPLYLRHQRSLITIRLKAGEGVDRSVLAYELAKDNVHTIIYSYGATEADNKEIKSLPTPATTDYTSSDFGTPAESVPTTDFSAIVEPHDYHTNATSEKIAEIRLSSQRFTFYASNDNQYVNAHADSPDASAVTHMENYNLEAGKHLVITATLGRESRKIVITAYVEDWTEAVTTSIVDDYGQAGDPKQIRTRQELYDFLNSSDNKPGTVGIIVPNSLNLEKNGDVDATWIPMPLNCTLNLAGAELSTNHRMFSTIGSSGNLVNGTIHVGNTTVESAVAEVNEGNIERVHVEPITADGKRSTGRATRAGLVVTNYGTILGCNSELPVQGTNAQVGGIAAVSIYKASSTTMPVIDGCTVNARVDGDDQSTGAGIVCEAEGRVTNNTFHYGRTLKQNTTNFKNTIHHKRTTTEGSPTLRAYGNAWPTTADANGNGIPATNVNATPEAERYFACIDSQEEMNAIFNTDISTYNQPSYMIRLSKDITLTKWANGVKSDVLNGSQKGNVYCHLDGDNHTITTDSMLFSNILGTIENLTVQLSGDIIQQAKTGNEAIATLGYRVLKNEGSAGRISNIRVKGGTHKISAPTAAGIVVWASSGATIENCQCKAIITSNLENIGDTRIYCGGIVANAAQATITRCIFHNSVSDTSKDDATLYRATTDRGNDSKVFFGGILGGTAPANSNSELPSVKITDCISWFSTVGNTQKGSVVGFAQYPDDQDNHKMYNGIAKDCEGNWWAIGSRGIGTWLATHGTDQEQIDALIGKRNAVAPTRDDSY